MPDGVYESFEQYMDLIESHAVFDYSEIISRAVAYLEGDPYEDDDFGRVQEHVRDDIKYVVVDEYQDVNPLQERLVRGLVRFGANLCVVGDDDQTIYQWRGSQVRNIVTFADRYAGVRQVTLDDNFRSSRGVVELGRSVADRIPANERLQEGNGRLRSPDMGARRPARARVRGSGRRSGLDCRPDRRDARRLVSR